MSLQGALGVLSHGGFRRLWIGETISLFGDVLSTTAFLWLVTDVSDEAMALSLVVASALAPRVLLSPYAGAVVDRFDRRAILVASDLAGVALQGLLVATLALSPRPPVPLLCAFALLVSSASAFGRLARTAAVPRLVPKDQLLPALSLTEASGELIPVLGLGLSAVVLSALFAVSRPLGYTLTFSLNGITFLASALLALGLPRMPPEGGRRAGGGLRGVREALAFLPSRPYLVQAIAVAGGVSLLMCASQAPLVVMARRRFDGAPSLLALLQASLSLGSVLGAVIALRLRPARPGPFFSAALLLSAACFMPLGVAGSPALFCALQLAAGAFLALAMITLNAAFQLAIPDAMRGRVNGADQMVGAMAGVTGSLASGWATDRLGVAAVYAGIGAGLACNALWALAAREIRHSTLRAPAEGELEGPLAAAAGRE